MLSIALFEADLQQTAAKTDEAGADRPSPGDLELTLENHRLGAIQGIVLDADGTTLKNWYTK